MICRGCIANDCTTGFRANGGLMVAWDCLAYGGVSGLHAGDDDGVTVLYELTPTQAAGKEIVTPSGPSA